jgi:hypothetical protein
MAKKEENYNDIMKDIDGILGGKTSSLHKSTGGGAEKRTVCIRQTHKKGAPSKCFKAKRSGGFIDGCAGKCTLKGMGATTTPKKKKTKKEKEKPFIPLKKGAHKNLGLRGLKDKDESEKRFIAPKKDDINRDLKTQYNLRNRKDMKKNTDNIYGGKK